MCGHHISHRKKNSSLQDLDVVDNLNKSLLEGPTIKALNLMKAVNTVRSKEHHYKEEFPELFKGLGKLEHVYPICLDVGAQPFSIVTPRRLSLPVK